jgi:putative spermidine/putrescine transport system permease protein
VQIVGGKTQLIGNLVNANISTNRPFSAALATIPVIIMIGYLTAVRRSGALEEL